MAHISTCESSLYFHYGSSQKVETHNIVEIDPKQMILS